VLARSAGDRSAQVDLDYVVPRYQGFTLGEFVYRPGGPLAARGYRRVIAPPRMRNAGDYLTTLASGPKAAPWSATSAERQDTRAGRLSRADIPAYRPVVHQPSTGTRFPLDVGSWIALAAKLGRQHPACHVCACRFDGHVSRMGLLIVVERRGMWTSHSSMAPPIERRCCRKVRFRPDCRAAMYSWKRDWLLKLLPSCIRAA
jgi:hypothetical protein